MKLSIVDTVKITVYDVAWVEINTPVGNMVIQEKHVPMIIELSSGHELIFELLDGELIRIMIVQAVAHVTREEVKILIPLAV